MIKQLFEFFRLLFRKSSIEVPIKIPSEMLAILDSLPGKSDEDVLNTLQVIKQHVDDDGLLREEDLFSLNTIAWRGQYFSISSDEENPGMLASSIKDTYYSKHDQRLDPYLTLVSMGEYGRL